MATEVEPRSKSADPPKVPELRAGDRLTREEFERRYRAMPHINKAELIEGVVYLPSPVSIDHASPDLRLGTWIGVYESATPGVQGGHNGTLRLDLDNAPQPDVYLRVLPQFGGQSRTSEDGYVEGVPELVAEVSASTVSYDLHDKLNACRRNGVKEYIVWRCGIGRLIGSCCVKVAMKSFRLRMASIVAKSFRDCGWSRRVS